MKRHQLYKYAMKQAISKKSQNLFTKKSSYLQRKYIDQNGIGPLFITQNARKNENKYLKFENKTV